MRSDRLLRGMNQVLTHDLPNQMVALQSLLQLLSMEEADQLTREGREYIRRLHNATQKACEQIRFLKEMGRMSTCVAKAESIALSTLARELQGELQQRHALTEFAFEWRWETPCTSGDVRTLRLALCELLGALMGPNARHCHLSGSSRSHAGEVELEFRLRGCQAGWTAQALEQRMEIALAREWLALSAASLEVALPGDGTVRLLISIPNRSNHV